MGRSRTVCRSKVKEVKYGVNWVVAIFPLFQFVFYYCILIFGGEGMGCPLQEILIQTRTGKYSNVEIMFNKNKNP